MAKYGKVAVAKHINLREIIEPQHLPKGMRTDVLMVIKDDFEENRKAVAAKWIEERGIDQGEKLQIVRLDDQYEKREVVKHETVVVKADDGDVDDSQVDLEEAIEAKKAEELGDEEADVEEDDGEEADAEEDDGGEDTSTRPPSPPRDVPNEVA